MTFKRKEELKAQLISLECVFIKYKLREEQLKLVKLQSRLALYYDTDKSIEHDCEDFISNYSDLVSRFDKETL